MSIFQLPFIQKKTTSVIPQEENIEYQTENGIISRMDSVRYFA
ncbi:hypothetical protein SDC9_164426 [bioreactor metagenome]|uniref:Uncharacterized protein n=1 Tax=bioreactor metagenome TaxID=1076179 RepID=A0A645FTK5_9ZZZZ